MAPSQVLKKRVFLSRDVFLFCLLGLFSLAFLPRSPALAQGRPPANVVVSPVVRESLQEELRLIGTAGSWRTSRVAAEVSGRVTAFLARRGKKVLKGDSLAELDASELLLKLKAFRARRNAALARLEKANDTLKRSKGLKREGLLSDKAFREAKLSAQELTEALAVNEAERLALEDALGKKKVRAPFSGTVTREWTEEGQWLSQGGPVLDLVDLSRIRILLQVPEKYVARIDPGSEVLVQFDALPEQDFPGKIQALIPEGDPASRLFPLEIQLENPSGLIKPGMLARVSLHLGTVRSVLMVPKDAVTRKGQNTLLFVVQGDKAAQRLVSTGQAKGDLIEILGPVKLGEAVVIRGNERLREGRAVRIVPAGESRGGKQVRPGKRLEEMSRSDKQ